MISFRTYADADALPDTWEELAQHAGNRYLSREYLRFTHSTNHFGQEYVMGFRKSTPVSLAVTHQQRVSVFEMMRHVPKPPTTMTFISPPASVSAPGITAVDAMALYDTVSHVAEQHAFTTVLNMPTDTTWPGWITLNGYPICALDITWNSFDEYVGSLRSSYRRHCKRVLQQGSELRFEFLQDTATQFTTEHYDLYTQVFRRSLSKVERLPISYFARGLGSIVSIHHPSVPTPLGFAQIYHHDDSMIFGFVGIDYVHNEHWCIYQNLLLWLVRHAIDSHASHLVFGQTAEDAKCRLGAISTPTAVLFRPRNPLRRWMHCLIGDRLSYQSPTTTFRVFK